jgi:hypothetical protein
MATTTNDPQLTRKSDRLYTLTVGDYNNGVGIQIQDTHRITFEVSKTSDHKNNNGNSATIEIYNLNPEQEKLLDSHYLEVSLHVGYKNSEGLKLLVSGNVTEQSTIKRGTDTITQLIIGDGYVNLTKARLSAMVSPGQTVEDVLRIITDNMPGVSRGSIVGTNLNSPVVQGWRLSGTPKDVLDKLTKAYGLEYHVSNNVLTVTDVNGPTSKSTILCPIISSETGMIEQPFRTQKQAKLPKKDKRIRYGLQFKVLLDAALVPSTVVKLESTNISGFFRIDSVRFTGDTRGNDWYAECQCSEMTDTDVTITS